MAAARPRVFMPRRRNVELAEQAGQILIAGVEGPSLSAEERAWFAPHPSRRHHPLPPQHRTGHAGRLAAARGRPHRHHAPPPLHRPRRRSRRSPPRRHRPHAVGRRRLRHRPAAISTASMDGSSPAKPALSASTPSSLPSSISPSRSPPPSCVPASSPPLRGASSTTPAAFSPA